MLILLGKIIAASQQTNKNMIFHLPPEFEQEILPFLDESQPTPKETVVVRLLENSWHKANIKAIMNFLFSIPCDLFFKSEDGKISFS